MLKTESLFRTGLLSIFMMATVFSFTACSDDDHDNYVEVEGVEVTAPVKKPSIKGLYVLNEGQMDKNKCSLDYFDYTSGIYYYSLFRAVNKDITLGLGDTGNDLKIHDNRLYAVINGSGLVEVMNAKTAKHVGMVEIPGCRSIAFNGSKAYVTSYIGEVEKNTNLQKGSVSEIDLKTLKVTRRCIVGYQPEGLVVKDGKIYVANSCAFTPDYQTFYDKTVSVIDTETMEVEKNIDVAINLFTMQLDKKGNIYVISRGNYFDVKSDVYVLNTNTGNVEGNLGLIAASTCLNGDSLYVIGNEFSSLTYTYERSFAIYNTKTKTIDSKKFITDGTDNQIVAPYGVAVNPENGDILIPDAGDYVNPGTMFCYNRDGRLLWKVTTGDIPGHMVFTETKVSGL